jgi:hypothetical protein
MTRLSDEDWARLKQAADNESVSLSEYCRKLLVESLGVSNLLIRSQMMGEERIRLMLLAAQQSKNLRDPQVQSQIDCDAVAYAVKFADIRVAVLQAAQRTATDAE